MLFPEKRVALKNTQKIRKLNAHRVIARQPPHWTWHLSLVDQECRPFSIAYPIASCNSYFTRIKIHVYNVEPWSGDHLRLPKCGFTTVLNIQEAIFVFLFFVDRTHERRIRWNGIGAKQK
jgi:hypothetical protein